MKSPGRSEPPGFTLTTIALLVTAFLPSLCAQPSITNQPQGQIVPQGYDVTFRVKADGNPPFSYQWQFTNAPIAGATNATLRLPNVQFGSAGNYSVIVSNAAGATLSSNATLVVTPPGAKLQSLTVSNAGDFVYDAGRDVIYVTTPTAIHRYHVGSNLFLSPIVCGVNLLGVDLSRDGQTLMVAEHSRLTNKLAVWVIDLPTETVQPLLFDADSNESGVAWLAFGADGAAVATTDYAGAAMVPLRRIHLGSNSVTGILAVNMGAKLAANPLGTFMAVNEGLSTDARLLLYDVATQAVVRTGPGTGTLQPLRPAVSPDGLQIVQPTTLSGGTFIYNANFDVITNFPGQNGGVIYHPSNQLMFIAWNGSQQLRALRPDTFVEQWRYDFGTSMLTDTRLRVSADGSLVLALLNDTLKFLRWTNAEPVITNQPRQDLVAVGGNGVFNVGAMGPPPIRYQWRFEDVDIEGATNAMLVVSNAQFANTGNYRVAVLGPNSFTLSSNAALTVNGPPQITADPQGAMLPAGTNLTLSVSAIGPGSFSYSWRLFGTNFGAPNTNVLTLTNLQAARAGDYTVVVGNSYGAVTSQVASVVVEATLPWLVQAPQSLTAPAGTNVTFGVVAGGSEPFSYQWWFNNAELVGCTNASLLLTNIQAGQAGDYTVVVSNVVGVSTSAVAVLTVMPSVPWFVGSPQNVTATVGAEVIFSASAAGAEPIGYYWQFNGADISDAVGSTLRFAALATNAGSYAAVATNAVGATTSAVATLTLTSPPGFLWARKGGSQYSEVGSAVVVDAAGNIYVAGDFSFSANIGGSNLLSSGGLDTYVAKYNPAGQLLWARKAGGLGDDSPNALALDSAGNLYVVGYFKSAIINFDGTTANNILPNGTSDAFVAQYDPDGNVLWVRGWGGNSNDEAEAVACDAADNVILCGSFSGSMYFGLNLLTNAGSTDVFIGKFTPSRDVAWVKRAGGPSSETALTLAADGVGNVFVGGTFFVGMDFGNGVTLSSPTVNEDELFLTKFAPDGTVLWARKATGSSTQLPTRMATDVAGNVFMVGVFIGTTVFDTLSATASGTDCFLAKYDAAGTIQWLRNVGDAGFGLALDEGGVVYLAGQFASTTSFGTNTLTTSGGNDVFVAAYTDNGAVLWVRKAGGSGSDLARGLALDGQGNIYVVGTFSSSPATFGHISLNASSSDMFLAKLATVDPAALPAFTSQPSNQTAVAGADIILASSYSGPQPITRQWWFNGVVLEGATNVTLVLSNATSALAGNYFLVLSNLNGMATSAVVNVSVATEPDFVWARRGGGASNDVALASVADESGNIYVAGYFTDTADFDGVNLVSAGGEDIFVARYNPLGTLLWVQQFGGAGNDRATALSREPLGGLVMAGTFSDTVLFDTNSLVSAGGTDVFLAHLTIAGSLNWVRRGGGASNDVAQAVAAHSQIAAPSVVGVYVAGYSQANATFGSTTLTISGTTNKMFLARYDVAGNFVWAATTANTGPSEGRALACDAGNYVYLGGTRAGSVSFGGLISTGAMSGFVARYSSGGNTASWVRWFGTAPNLPTVNNRVNGLALDTNSNIYVTGEFQGEAYLLGGTNGPISYNTNQADGFFLKLDPTSTPQWVKTISGPGADAGNSVTLDALGNPYVTGSFTTSAAIGNTLLTGAGGQDMFVALFDTTGTLVKARRAGGAADDFGRAVATSGTGSVFVAGSHAAAAAFGTDNLDTAGGSEAFLTRVDFISSQAPPQITTQPQSQSLQLGSNLVLNVGAISSLPVTYRWRLNGIDISGFTSNSFRLNSTQPARLGDYTVVVQNSVGAVTSQVATVAQEFTPDYWWLRRTGSTSDDQALAVAVDATNNAVYVAGLFIGTNPGLGNLIASNGISDGFLARYDLNGNLIWARRFGGTSQDVAQAVTVDRTGNILVGGYFLSSSAGFGSFLLTNRSTPTASAYDLFLAKFDPDGNVLWARRAGGTSNPNILNRSDVATALVADGEANIYLTGSFHSVVDFGSLQLTNLNSTNFFLAKYDRAGNILWARTTSGTNTSQGNGLCLDATTNVYVTGSFLGSLNLGGGLLTNANNSFLNSSAFVAKYDRDGTLQWARKTPGTAGVGQAVAVDALGSLYATSYKRDYGNGLLLAKYDSAGTPLWQRSAAISCCTGDYTSAAGLAVDRFGNPIVVGYGNGSIEGITNSFTGGYALKYRSDGSGFWMLRCASLATSGTGPAAIALDEDDNAYIVGRFTGTSYFGATSNLVSAGLSDTFLAKLGLRPPEMVGTMTNRLVVAGSNATLQAVGVLGSGNLSYQWQLNGTNLVGATNGALALNNFSYDRAGRYAVIISNQVGVTTGQVAGVGFVPVLNIAAAPGAAVLDWSGLFTLQAAAQATGPYVDVTPAMSPFTNLIGPGASQRYFRLRVPSPDVAGSWEAGGFNVNLLGSPGRRYVVESSPNLVNWTPVVTNYFPFTFQDTNFVVAPQKFYRARLLP